jgi:hypothetical protein
VDPDPSLFVGIRILPLSSKKSKKKLIFNVLRLPGDFLSLKIDAIGSSKNNKPKF